MSSFNPALRYGSVPTGRSRGDVARVARFNPALRYGSVPTLITPEVALPPYTFQSRSAVWVGTDRIRPDGETERDAREAMFQSRSAVWVGTDRQAAPRERTDDSQFQSRSAVWVGTDQTGELVDPPTPPFQSRSAVWVGTDPRTWSAPAPSRRFQSRSAVWVGTDVPGSVRLMTLAEVSIPLCGMGRYRPCGSGGARRRGWVSIPLCGMGRYRPERDAVDALWRNVSIPLCGMGRYRPPSVQITTAAGIHRFQSRSAVWVGTDRDSTTVSTPWDVCFNPALRYGSVPTGVRNEAGELVLVSIPLCGMGRYRPSDRLAMACGMEVSIPLCGMGRYRLPCWGQEEYANFVFQSRSAVWVGTDGRSVPEAGLRLLSFNPALRYGSVPTPPMKREHLPPWFQSRSAVWVGTDTVSDAAQFDRERFQSRSAVWVGTDQKGGGVMSNELTRFNPALRYGSVPTPPLRALWASTARFNPALRYGSVPTCSGATASAGEAKVSIPLCGMGRYRLAPIVPRADQPVKPLREASIPTRWHRPVLRHQFTLC